MARLWPNVALDLTAHDFVASPLGRARETMEIARAVLTLDPVDYRLEPDLKELSYGHWQGVLQSELPTRDPEGLASTHQRSVPLASRRRRELCRPRGPHKALAQTALPAIASSPPTAARCAACMRCCLICLHKMFQPLPFHRTKCWSSKTATAHGYRFLRVCILF